MSMRAGSDISSYRYFSALNFSQICTQNTALASWPMNTNLTLNVCRIARAKEAHNRGRSEFFKMKGETGNTTFHQCRQFFVNQEKNCFPEGVNAWTNLLSHLHLIRCFFRNLQNMQSHLRPTNHITRRKYCDMKPRVYLSGYHIMECFFYLQEIARHGLGQRFQIAYFLPCFYHFHTAN